MGADIEPGRPRRLSALVVFGLLALIPAGGVIAFGMAGLALPALFRNPILVFGGLVFALLVSVAASVRLRSEHTPGALRLECDVRIRYRGAGSAVVIMAWSIAMILVLYRLAGSFASR